MSEFFSSYWIPMLCAVAAVTSVVFIIKHWDDPCDPDGDFR